MTKLFAQRPGPNVSKKFPQKQGVTLFILILFVISLQGAIPPTAHPNTKPEKKVDDPVVAIVNGQEILKSEVDMRVAAYRQKTGKIEVRKDEITELLKGVIRRHLILSMPQVQNYRNTPQFINQVREYENNLIVNNYLTKNIGPSLDISEQQMRDYYKQNRDEFAINPSVEARHILLRSKEEAEEVLHKLELGHEFGDLAKKYSIDLPKALEGGSMGVIQKGRVLPELEKALFFLAEGEISEIIKTQFGYHILIVDKIQPAGFKPFEEARSQIRNALIRKNEAQAFNKMAEELEKNADITVYDENLHTGPAS